MPSLRTLIDRSPSDAIFLEPNDALREEPFILPDVLGYLGMPDPRRWAVPTDYKVLLGMVKVARCLEIEELLNQLGNSLEIPPAELKTMQTGKLMKKIRSQIRSVHSINYCILGMLVRT